MASFYSVLFRSGSKLLRMCYLTDLVYYKIVSNSWTDLLITYRLSEGNAAMPKGSDTFIRTTPQAGNKDGLPARIIFDADTTMGIPDCDIDDGLAILYALGYAKENPEAVTIEGICTSFGNSTIETVYRATNQICHDLELVVPILKGSGSPDQLKSDASHFIVDMAEAYPGELTLAVTGSTTNLKSAQQLDRDVLSKYKQVVLMGGITQSLVFNGQIMNELNWSCDPEASLAVLEAANRGAQIVVFTANNCLDARFYPQEFSERLRLPCGDGGYLWRTCSPWFDTMQQWYDYEGFICWDVLVTAWILDPWLFEDQPFDALLDPQLMKAGFIQPAFDGAPQASIITPRIRDARAFSERCYKLWREAIG